MELESQSGSNTPYSGANTPLTRLLNFPDAEFKILRQLGITQYGASTVGECFEAVRRVHEGVAADWAQAWSGIAAELEAVAETSESASRDARSGEMFLRAANYFQMAEYYAIMNGGTHVQLGLKSQECFEKALHRMPTHNERFDLATGDQKLVLYFLAPDNSGATRPTVMLVPGIESSAEEMYFFHGVTALERGYNVVIFQGPGQSGVLRIDPDSCLRHDYEIPLQVALDFLHDRRDVDSERLALVGDGIGSYLCMRVAAFDPRVKALVSNPPYVEMRPLFSEMIGHRAMIVDVEIDELNELPPSILRNELKLLIKSMGRRFGALRLHTLLQKMEAYAVGDLLYRIHCPVLSLGGSFLIPEMVRQEQQFIDSVRSDDKTLIRIPSLHYADAHNHFSNLPLLNQHLFDWLDDRFLPD
ncbi:MAG: alpha/beta hydrolase [Bacteroidetes bacterium]|nr:alpha/beta hydrolase [Bacteroidota bacterium]